MNSTTPVSSADRRHIQVFTELQVRRAQAESLWQRANELETADPAVSFALRMQAIQSWTGMSRLEIGRALQPIVESKKPVGSSTIQNWMSGDSVPAMDKPQDVFQGITPVEAFVRLVKEYEAKLPPEAVTEVGGGFFEAAGREQEFTDAYFREATRRHIPGTPKLPGHPNTKLSLRRIRAETLWKKADGMQETMPGKALGLRFQATREYTGMNAHDFRVALEPLLELPEPLHNHTVRNWEKGVFPNKEIPRGALVDGYAALSSQAEGDREFGFMDKKNPDGMTRRDQLAQSHDRAAEWLANESTDRLARRFLRVQASDERLKAGFRSEHARYAEIAARRAARESDDGPDGAAR